MPLHTVGAVVSLFLAIALVSYLTHIRQDKTWTTFASDYAVDLAVARLSRLCLSSRPVTLQSEWLMGRVQPGSVFLSWRVTDTQNSFAYRGAFTETNGNVSLTGTFAFSLWTKAFLVTWFSVLIYLYFWLYQVAMQYPEKNVLGDALFPSAFILGGCLLVRAIKRTTPHHIKWISISIQSAIQHREAAS